MRAGRRAGSLAATGQCWSTVDIFRMRFIRLALEGPGRLGLVQLDTPGNNLRGEVGNVGHVCLRQVWGHRDRV